MSNQSGVRLAADDRRFSCMRLIFFSRGESSAAPGHDGATSQVPELPSQTKARKHEPLLGLDAVFLVIVRDEDDTEEDFRTDVAPDALADTGGLKLDS